MSQRQPKRRKLYSSLSLFFLSISLLLTFILFGRELMISLQQYDSATSQWTWVGLFNYSQLFEMYFFPVIIFNTVRFNFLFALFVFALAVLIGYGLKSLPDKFRTFPIMLLLLIVFLPAQVYAHWWIHLLPINTLLSPDWMKVVHPLLGAIKYVGVPVALIYALIHYLPKDRWVVFKGAGLFSFSVLAFIGTGLFSLTSAIYNPAIAQAIDSLDNYVVRTGPSNVQYSMQAALNVVSSLLSLISLLIMIVPIWLLVRATFKYPFRKTQLSELGKETETVQRKQTKSSVLIHHAFSSLAAFTVFTVVYFLPYWIAGTSMWPEEFQGKIALMEPIARYFSLSLLISLGSVLIALAIAGIFRTNHKLLLWSASAALAIITLLSLRTRSIAEYFTIMEWGLSNTFAAVFLTSVFSTAAIWALAAVWRMEDKLTRKVVATSIIGLLLIQAALHYGNVWPILMYISDTSQFSPVMLFRQMTNMPPGAEMPADRAALQGGFAFVGFLVSLPALFLYLLAHLIVPGRRLLLMITGGMKE